jgi:hypothetical protein
VTSSVSSRTMLVTRAGALRTIGGRWCSQHDLDHIISQIAAGPLGPVRALADAGETRITRSASTASGSRNWRGDRQREVVKGYEYARGEFVTFTAEELKALDVESSKVIATVGWRGPWHIAPNQLARQLVAAGFPHRRRVRYKEPPEGISQ